MNKIFLITLTVLLVACAPVSTAASPAATRDSAEIIPVSGSSASNTPAPLPSRSPVPSKTKTTAASLKTPTPPPTAVACLHLTSPANGASLSKTGNIEFSWGSQHGAELYVLSLISQEGRRQDARTTITRLTRSLGRTSKSGSYYWSVSAYDAKGYFLCNSGFIHFSRGTGGAEKQASAAANSCVTTCTYKDLVDQDLIVPPPAPVAGSPDPFDPYIAPDENPAAANQEIIVPHEPPSTSIPLPEEPTKEPPATQIVPPEPPPTQPAVDDSPPTDPPGNDPAPTDPPADNPPPAEPPATDVPTGP